MIQRQQSDSFDAFTFTHAVNQYKAGDRAVC